MKYPDFYIVGAPKCGTTALYHYLSEHPGVFLPFGKEPHYFADDLEGMRDVKSLDEYLAMFTPRRQHQKCGEASVMYLYSHVAVDRILEANPDARLIVMLRNPLELVPSLHSQCLVALFEDQTDLAAAWRLQAERAAGRSLPDGCPEPKMLQYAEIARLGAQLERFLERAPRAQVKLILFDDFAADTPRIYAEVLEFLGLPSDGRTEFPRVNANKALRSRWLHRWLDYRRVPHSVRRAGRLLGLHRLHYRIKMLNMTAAKRQPLDPAMRAEMASAFRDDVGRLSALLQRDLSHWLTAA